MIESKVVHDQYRQLYNTVRRHRALKMTTPAAFRAKELETKDPTCNLDADSPIGKTSADSKKRGL